LGRRHHGSHARVRAGRGAGGDADPLRPGEQEPDGAGRRGPGPVRAGASFRRANLISGGEPMYVSQGGVRLFYQVTGRGPDLFLLPQCQPVTYSRQWKGPIPSLSRYFRVITMDQRGTGRSDRPPRGYDLGSRYQDLLAVLEATAHPPFALVAYACAGLLAVRYAVEHPEHLSRLV